MTNDMLWHSPWLCGEKRLCFNTIRCAIAHGIARSSLGLATRTRLNEAESSTRTSLPTIAATLGHANLQTTTVYTIAASLEAPDFSARTRGKEGNSAESCA